MPVTAPSDRRFRRAHVKPARHRRQLPARIARSVRAGLVVVVVAGGGYYAAHAAVEARALTVTTIRIRGTHHLAEGEVLALVDGLRGQHILAVDLRAWRERLLASPWVGDAALRRVLPSTIEIVVQERQPMALARFGADLYLMDDDGRVIDDYGPNYAALDLPIVDGLADAADGRAPEIDPVRAQLAARAIAEIAARPDVLARVSQIDVRNPHDAVVALDSDTAVLHVGEERFLERLQTYFGLAEALRARVPDIAYVDLRFADRVYVRPASGSRRASSRPASEPDRH